MTQEIKLKGQGCEFDDIKPGPSREEIQAALDWIMPIYKFHASITDGKKFLVYDVIVTVLTQALERAK